MKWKLNIRKEIKIATALLAISFLIAFSSRKQDGLVCKDILIDLENVNENHFLDEADVMRLVDGSGQKIIGNSLDNINLKAIETRLKYDRHILNAELFSDLKGTLVVHVELRRPIARIVQEDAPDAYIAEDGTIMSVSEKYSSRVTLLSGAYMKTLLKSENLKENEVGSQLLEMVKYINDDNFWKAQIAQLDVNANGKIFIYPQMTSQRVEFGRVDGFELKLKKLMIFYKEILPQKGWTHYERVNLEYEGQIVAE